MLLLVLDAHCCWLQALALISNLASGNELHVQLLLDWAGSELLDLVSLLLQHSDPKVVKQASTVWMPAACLDACCMAAEWVLTGSPHCL